MNASREFGFGPQQRLRRPVEFRRVFDARHSVADETLVVYGSPNDQSGSRLGLSVSKKIGGAVVRNRWKRHIREAFRHQQADLSGWDVIVIPRRGASCDSMQIARSLSSLLRRLRRKRQRKKQQPN